MEMQALVFKLNSTGVRVRPLCLIRSWNLTPADVLVKLAQERILKRSVPGSVFESQVGRSSQVAPHHQDVEHRLGGTAVFGWPVTCFAVTFFCTVVCRTGDVLVRSL